MTSSDCRNLEIKMRSCDTCAKIDEANKEIERLQKEKEGDKKFHNHIKSHFEKEHPNWKVICKICNKTYEEITGKAEKPNSLTAADVDEAFESLKMRFCVNDTKMTANPCGKCFYCGWLNAEMRIMKKKSNTKEGESMKLPEINLTLSLLKWRIKCEKTGKYSYFFHVQIGDKCYHL